jgi:DnaJ domain
MGISCYQVLGINPPVSMSDVKLAYRKAAAIHHPDRGGSHQAMVDVNHAYEQAKWELERIRTRNGSQYPQSEPPRSESHQADPLSVWIENIDNLIKQQSENGYRKGWVMFRLLQSDTQPPLKAWEYLAKKMEYKDGWASIERRK